MISKNKLIYLGVAIIIATLWYVLYSGAEKNQPLDLADVAVDKQLDTKESTEDKIKQDDTLIQANLQKNAILMQPDFSNFKTKRIFYRRCKLDANTFYNFRRKTDVVDMTERQLAIYEKLASDCHAWYDYYNALSSTEQDNLTAAIEARSRKFSRYTFPEQSQELTNEVVNILKKGVNEDSDFGMIDSQLVYLLMHDTDLQVRLADKLGAFNAYGFANSVAPAASVLFMCHYRDCSSDSPQMLTSCMTSDEACGHSVSSWLQSISTHGQYIDGQNAAIVLKEIFESDWFQNRDTTDP